jgi:D-glycero-D-manno-heptose 1,7-bisphosphate phosphatase
LIADESLSVLQWLAKEDDRPTYYKNRVNAGLHVISPKILEINRRRFSLTGMVSLISM